MKIKIDEIETIYCALLTQLDELKKNIVREEVKDEIKKVKKLIKKLEKMVRL
jgi:hypothetical protein